MSNTAWVRLQQLRQLILKQPRTWTLLPIRQISNVKRAPTIAENGRVPLRHDKKGNRNWIDSSIEPILHYLKLTFCISNLLIVCFVQK
jgi:hypothetical protein